MKTIKLIYWVALSGCLWTCTTKAKIDTEAPLPKAEQKIVALTAEQYKNSGIELGQISKQVLHGTIHATGMLDVPPQNLIHITAPFGGFLRATTLLQGMFVKKGQKIAVIENPDYIQLQQEFLDSECQSTFLEAEFHRQEELAKENINSQKTWQKTQADWQSMKAKNRGLRAKLKMLHINPDQLNRDGDIQSTIHLYSPINGYVTQVNSALGAFVNSIDPIFKIVDTRHLHAELMVFERDLPRLKVGQMVHFILTNEKDSRTATVYLIGKEILPDRTIRIHCHLKTEDSQLVPGLYLQATIEVDSTPVTVLPEEAVVNFEDAYYIFMTKANQENQFELIDIQVGQQEDGYIEVKIPAQVIASKRPVVIKGAYKLLAKMKNSEESQ